VSPCEGSKKRRRRERRSGRSGTPPPPTLLLLLLPHTVRVKVKVVIALLLLLLLRFFFFFFLSSSSVEKIIFFLRPISHSDDACLFRVFSFFSFWVVCNETFCTIFFKPQQTTFLCFFCPQKFLYTHNAKQKMLQLSSSRTIISPSSAQFTNKRKSSSLNNNRRSNNNNGGFLQISAISAADVTGPVKETLGDLQSVEVRNFGNNSSLWSNSIILKKILSFFLCARGVGGGRDAFVRRERTISFLLLLLIPFFLRPFGIAS